MPFAAPPVGDLRWRAPQPVKPWKGTRSADHFGPSCMQIPIFAQRYAAPPALSEDCLYLNVWTNAKSARERLPVMVWIYGGGLTSGTTSSAWYDGTHLAHKSVVLVTVAYRVGALGFLVHPELSAESPNHVSGNYGLLDVISALEWVQANIAKFGGDSSRVTILGQSAGGDIVNFLAQSPLAKGLFQRAISESCGSGYSGVPTLRTAQAASERFMAKLGANDIAAARALPADTLVKAQSGALPPVIDGYVLPGNWYELYQTGRLTETPLLLGSNADEGRLFAPPAGTPARFEENLRARFGTYADAILALYPHATDAEAEQAASDVLRDRNIGWATWQWAFLQSKHGAHSTY
ncbi:MAG: carboxylesterase/lipase family protein, partial [Mycobacteriales bacterium]